MRGRREDRPITVEVDKRHMVLFAVGVSSPVALYPHEAHELSQAIFGACTLLTRAIRADEHIYDVATRPPVKDDKGSRGWRVGFDTTEQYGRVIIEVPGFGIRAPLTTARSIAASMHGASITAQARHECRAKRG